MYKTSLFSILCYLSIVLLITACSDTDDDALDCLAYEWGYEGDSAPETWGTCFDNCSGSSQSPVNIAQFNVDEELLPLEFNYHSSPIHLVNNGHTLEFEYHGGSVLIYNETAYELIQFHFHTVSEHQVDGSSFPMEIHLVHKKNEHELAVVSLLVEVGAENQFLQAFADHLPAESGEILHLATTVNIEDLLPEDKSYYTYQGSLTTPPCSEVVTWIIIQQPVQASQEQINKFSQILNGNYRPVVDLGNRLIRLFEE